MVSMVYPAANNLLLSIYRGGPQDDQEWTAVKRSAVLLAESGTVLLARGPAGGQGDWAQDARMLVDAGAAAYKRPAPKIPMLSSPSRSRSMRPAPLATNSIAPTKETNCVAECNTETQKCVALMKEGNRRRSLTSCFVDAACRRPCSRIIVLRGGSCPVFQNPSVGPPQLLESARPHLSYFSVRKSSRAGSSSHAPWPSPCPNGTSSSPSSRNGRRTCAQNPGTIVQDGGRLKDTND